MTIVAHAVHEAPHPRSATRKNRKLNQVMAAARTCFLGQAYDFVTMDAVARAAGVSKATLYAYFPSKEMLFFALVKEKCRQLESDIWRAASGKQLIDEALKAIASNFMATFATDEAIALFRIMVAEAHRFPELGRSFYEAGPKMLIARIAEFLADARDRGLLDIPNPELAATQFIGLIQGDFHIKGLLLPMLPTPAEREEAIESGIALFMAGYRRKPDPV